MSQPNNPWAGVLKSSRSPGTPDTAKSSPGSTPPTTDDKSPKTPSFAAVKLRSVGSPDTQASTEKVASPPIGTTEKEKLETPKQPAFANVKLKSVGSGASPVANEVKTSPVVPSSSSPSIPKETAATPKPGPFASYKLKSSSPSSTEKPASNAVESAEKQPAFAAVKLKPIGGSSPAASIVTSRLDAAALASNRASKASPVASIAAVNTTITATPESTITATPESLSKKDGSPAPQPSGNRLAAFLGNGASPIASTAPASLPTTTSSVTSTPTSSSSALPSPTISADSTVKTVIQSVEPAKTSMLSSSPPKSATVLKTPVLKSVESTAKSSSPILSPSSSTGSSPFAVKLKSVATKPADFLGGATPGPAEGSPSTPPIVALSPVQTKQAPSPSLAPSPALPIQLKPVNAITPTFAAETGGKAEAAAVASLAIDSPVMDRSSASPQGKPSGNVVPGGALANFLGASSLSSKGSSVNETTPGTKAHAEAKAPQLVTPASASKTRTPAVVENVKPSPGNTSPKPVNKLAGFLSSVSTTTPTPELAKVDVVSPSPPAQTTTTQNTTDNVRPEAAVAVAGAAERMASASNVAQLGEWTQHATTSKPSKGEDSVELAQARDVNALSAFLSSTDAKGTIETEAEPEAATEEQPVETENTVVEETSANVQVLMEETSPSETVDVEKTILPSHISDSEGSSQVDSEREGPMAEEADTEANPAPVKEELEKTAEEFREPEVEETHAAVEAGVPQNEISATEEEEEEDDTSVRNILRGRRDNTSSNKVAQALAKMKEKPEPTMLPSVLNAIPELEGEDEIVAKDPTTGSPVALHPEPIEAEQEAFPARDMSKTYDDVLDENTFDTAAQETSRVDELPNTEPAAFSSPFAKGLLAEADHAPIEGQSGAIAGSDQQAAAETLVVHPTHEEDQSNGLKTENTLEEPHSDCEEAEDNVEGELSRGTEKTLESPNSDREEVEDNVEGELSRGREDEPATGAEVEQFGNVNEQESEQQVDTSTAPQDSVPLGREEEFVDEEDIHRRVHSVSGEVPLMREDEFVDECSHAESTGDIPLRREEEFVDECSHAESPGDIPLRREEEFVDECSHSESTANIPPRREEEFVDECSHAESPDDIPLRREEEFVDECGHPEEHNHAYEEDASKAAGEELPVYENEAQLPDNQEAPVSDEREEEQTYNEDEEPHCEKNASEAEAAEVGGNEEEGTQDRQVADQVHEEENGRNFDQENVLEKEEQGQQLDGQEEALEQPIVENDEDEITLEQLLERAIEERDVFATALEEERQNVAQAVDLINTLEAEHAAFQQRIGELEALLAEMSEQQAHAGSSTAMVECEKCKATANQAQSPPALTKAALVLVLAVIVQILLLLFGF